MWTEDGAGPDKLLDAQKAVSEGRWLDVHRPGELNLNPSWAGEAVKVDPLTANSSSIKGQSDFSFAAWMSPAASYDDAFKKLNDALKNDPAMLKQAGVDPKKFQGVSFMASGHENARLT